MRAHAFAVSLALAATLSPSARQAEAPLKTFVVDSGWVPVQVGHGLSGDVLGFRNGQRLALDLFNVSFLGQLPRPGRAPLLIVGAWGCKNCDIEAQIYPIPADAKHYEFGERGAYYYPGTMSPGGDETDTMPFWRGRMFVGGCLDHQSPVVLWFEADRDSVRAWHANVYRLAVAGDSAVGGFLKPMPLLSATLEAVKAGKCFEIPGKDQQQY